MIADTAPAPPVTPGSPPVLVLVLVLELELPMPAPAALASVVVPAAKMRSRAALYRAERSAKVPAPIGAAAAEVGELGLELSLASAAPFF
jgi:hypothetical protein